MSEESRVEGGLAFSSGLDTVTGCPLLQGERNGTWEPLGRRQQIPFGHTESEASQGNPEMVLRASSSK